MRVVVSLLHPCEAEFCGLAHSFVTVAQATTSGFFLPGSFPLPVAASLSSLFHSMIGPYLHGSFKPLRKTPFTLAACSPLRVLSPSVPLDTPQELSKRTSLSLISEGFIRLPSLSCFQTPPHRNSPLRRPSRSWRFTSALVLDFGLPFHIDLRTLLSPLDSFQLVFIGRPL